MVANNVLMGAVILIGSLTVTAVTVDTLENLAERPPIAIKRVETITPHVAAGFPVTVRIHRVKDYDCPLTSWRKIEGTDGRIWDTDSEPKARGGPVGSDYVDVDYPTPADLPAGEYVLSVRLVYNCPERPWVIEQEPAQFVVR